MPAPSGSSQNFSKKVAIFGLSADPPTGDGGHAGVVQQLASMVDEVSFALKATLERTISFPVIHLLSVNTFQ